MVLTHRHSFTVRKMVDIVLNFNGQKHVSSETTWSNDDSFVGQVFKPLAMPRFVDSFSLLQSVFRLWNCNSSTSCSAPQDSLKCLGSRPLAQLLQSSCGEIGEQSEELKQEGCCCLSMVCRGNLWWHDGWDLFLKIGFPSKNCNLLDDFGSTSILRNCHLKMCWDILLFYRCLLVDFPIFFWVSNEALSLGFPLPQHFSRSFPSRHTVPKS